MHFPTQGQTKGGNDQQWKICTYMSFWANGQKPEILVISGQSVSQNWVAKNEIIAEDSHWNIMFDILLMDA